MATTFTYAVTPIGGVVSNVVSGQSTVSVLVASSYVFAYDAQGQVLGPAVGPVLPPGQSGPLPNVFTTPTPGITSANTGSPSLSQTPLTPSISSATSVTASSPLISSPAVSPAVSSRISSSRNQQSTTSSSPTSTASSSSQTSSTPSSAVSRTSLIATATVLGALLAIAIIVLLFIIFRRRKNAYRRQESSESTVELKNSPDRTVSDLKSTITGLEKSLEDRDATIRRTQAAALQNGRSFGDSSLGDAEIRDRFTTLSHSINDWVLTYFKGTRLDNVQNPDVAEALRKSVPNYQRLIGDPRSKYLVLRAVISDIIVEAFSNGQFIGSAAYEELKKGLEVDATSPDSREWGAMTGALLEKSPRAREQRTSAIETAVRKIDYISSNLASLEFSEQRTSQLRACINNAADLATVFAKQPALYTLAIEQPGSTFDGETMEDALQETNAYVLRGRKIQGTVFPAVLKRSGAEGSGMETLCVRRAQIIA